MRLNVFLPAALLVASSLHAQELGTSFLEKNAVESDTEISLEERVDLHYRLRTQPVDLNRAGKEELEECGLFSDFQIHALLTHRSKTGDLLSLYELQAVEGFEPDYIREILPFVCIGATRWFAAPEGLLPASRQQLLIKVKQVAERSRGYREQHYSGSPLHLSARYRGAVNGKLSIGINAEKDPGEAFLGKGQPYGFDHYSGYLHLKNHRAVNHLVLGDYGLSYGQGLVTWGGFSLRKPPDVLLGRKYGHGIRPHTGMDESRLLRGGATSLRRNRWQWDVFCSRRQRDANVLTKDPVSGKVLAISSLQESGYHRSESELEDRRSITQLIAGSHVEYSTPGMKAGLTIAGEALSAVLSKEESAYTGFDYEGRIKRNASFDYSIQRRNISFFGETAGSGSGGLASVNGLLAGLDPSFALLLVGRYYGRSFHSMMGNAFGNAAEPANEKGIFAGISWKLPGPWQAAAFYDISTSPWLRYRASTLEPEKDAVAQLSGTFSKQLEMRIRLRIREEQQDEASGEPVRRASGIFRRSLSLHLSYKATPSIVLRSRVEVLELRSAPGTEEGSLLYQDIVFNPPAGRLSFSFRYALFDTDSYNTRIYAYENDVLYSFSVPAYYYRGSKTYLTVQYSPWPDVDLWLRIAQLAYAGRDAVGSGWDEIPGNRRTEITLQGRIKF
jgi:hypothetical protein